MQNRPFITAALVCLLMQAGGCGGSDQVSPSFQPNYVAYMIQHGGVLNHYGTRTITFGAVNASAEQKALIKKGGKLWTSALNSQGYQIQFTTAPNPQITVKVVSYNELMDFFTAHDLYAPYAIGVTYIDIDSASGYIVSSVSLVLETAWTELDVGDHLAGHELGHALCQGHSDNPADLMYATVPQRLSPEPTLRDNNTLAYVYSGIAAAAPTKAQPSPGLMRVIVAVDAL